MCVLTTDFVVAAAMGKAIADRRGPERGGRVMRWYLARLTKRAQERIAFLPDAARTFQTGAFEPRA